MRNLPSLYLCVYKTQSGYVIKCSKTDLIIKTVRGNDLVTKNKDLLEHALLEIQICREIAINSNDSIYTENWNVHPFFLYFSISTEIDYAEDNHTILPEQIFEDLVEDNFLYIFGREPKLSVTGYANFLLELDKTLFSKGIDLKCASFTFSDVAGKVSQGEKERRKLSELISKEYNLGSPFQKAIYAAVIDTLHSDILAWVISFTDIEPLRLVIGRICQIDFGIIGVNENCRDLVTGILEDKVDPQKPGKDILIPQDERTEIYNNHKTVFENLRNFRRLSQKLPLEISREESIKHEYKSSFSAPFPDYPKSSIDENGQTFYQVGNKKFSSKKSLSKFIEEQSLKTIVGFLNTRGGTLVIGVNEQQGKNVIVGIETDEFKDRDSYERHIIQQISNRVGSKFLSKHVTIDFINHLEKMVCVIRCLEFKPNQNETPVYLDGERTFRRTGARTDEIKRGEEIAKFTIERIQDM